MIAHVRIEIDGLVGIGQVLRLRDHGGVPGKVFGEEVAVGSAPSRDSGRRIDAHGGANRTGLQVGGRDRNLGSADEVQAAMVEVVGVEVIEAMLLGAGAHVDVDKPVVERGKHSGSDVSHEMLADLAARVRQTIWEFPGL